MRHVTELIPKVTDRTSLEHFNNALGWLSQWWEKQEAAKTGRHVTDLIAEGPNPYALAGLARNLRSVEIELDQQEAAKAARKITDLMVKTEDCEVLRSLGI